MLWEDNTKNLKEINYECYILSEKYRNKKIILLKKQEYSYNKKKILKNG